jgi:hypothetical protein
LHFGLSYRDVEVLLAERGIKVDHVAAYRWVQRRTFRLWLISPVNGEERGRRGRFHESP